MSLQVWLPLNGDLHNQGLSNYNISMLRGSATFDNSGKISKCFYANGVNTIRIENIISDFYNYSGYSLCAWFYIEAQNTTHSGSGIISAGNWNSQILNLALSGWSTDHYTQLQVSGTSWNKIYNYTFNKNTWYHVVVSSDGSKTYAYVNGVLIGNTQPGFLPTSIEGNNIAIGGATYYAGMQFFGKINDVRIYDHCLSDKEVEEIARGLVLHYKLDNIIDNNIYDCSGYQNNGITAGDSILLSENVIKYSHSISLPTDNWIRVLARPNIISPKDAITVNIWANISTSWTYNRGCIVSCQESGGWAIGKNSSGMLYFEIYADGAYQAAVVDNKSYASGILNSWHMFTGTADSSNVKLFLDGELLVTKENIATTNFSYYNNYIFVGAEAKSNTVTPYSAIDGLFSDFRIYATALTQEQIQELYHTSASIDNQGNIYARELVEI